MPLRAIVIGTRILEKQNSLQMSQNFSHARTLVIRLLCFSRILQAGPRNPKVLNSKTSSIREHESKPKRDMAIGSGDLPRPLTFTNFGPAKARPLHHVDAAPNPTLIPLSLAGLRRGLARILEKQNRLQMSQVLSLSEHGFS